MAAITQLAFERTVRIGFEPGIRLATGDATGRVVLWNVNTGQAYVSY